MDKEDGSKKLLLIGWDAADWKTLSPMLDEGLMPNLLHLVETGVKGNLSTISPILSPMLWTSIATGKRPYKHGVHGFSEPDPEGNGVRPITNLSRKTKAIWNILNQQGKKCNVVGWWPSHPAEPIDGVMVSNRFQQPERDFGQPWVMRPGTVHPPELESKLSEFRIHPQELDEGALLPFIPNAKSVDQTKDRRIYSCAKTLAECSSIHAATTYLMENTEWDFMATYYDAIDHFGHGFMKYNPPKQSWVSDSDFELYKHVVRSGYRYHDMMLGRLLQLAGPETTVILMSDHGFHPDSLRPRHIPNEPAGPAAEHRPFGVFVAAGPGIKKDELVMGASILDLCPTVLNHFQLPVGNDMDGQVLSSIFEQPTKVARIESWDEVDGPHDAGLHPANTRLDPMESKAAIDQLVALGYIEEPDEDSALAVKKTVRELSYNLARSYADGNQLHDASDQLEQLYEQWPQESRFGVMLFHVQLGLNQVTQARETLQQVIERKAENATLARKEMEEIQQQLKAHAEAKAGELAEAKQVDPAEAPTNAPTKDPDKAPATPSGQRDEIEKKLFAKIPQLRRQANVNPHAIAFLEGTLLHAEGKFEEAVQSFQKADAAEPNSGQMLHLKIGEVQLEMRRFKLAKQSFERVLDWDPVNPQARCGLAQAFLKLKMPKKAAEQARLSVGQTFHNPTGHFILGVALNRCGKSSDAIKSLELAVRQNPVFPLAHQVLSFLYSRQIDGGENAERYRELARQARQRVLEYSRGERPQDRHQFRSALRAENDAISIENAYRDAMQSLEEFAEKTRDCSVGKDVVTVVSGLPRSGTSMAMQMLSAGGMPILQDDHRPADESNPRGYLELEHAKSLGSRKPKLDWLAEAEGKGFKLVAQLLPNLIFKLKTDPETPALELSYRIVMMHRPLDEVIASQQKLLDRLGKSDPSVDGLVVKRAYLAQLSRVHERLVQWSKDFPTRLAVLPIGYHDALADPSKTAQRINEFVGGRLDVAAMEATIDRGLRNEYHVDENSSS